MLLLMFVNEEVVISNPSANYSVRYLTKPRRSFVFDNRDGSKSKCFVDAIALRVESDWVQGKVRERQGVLIHLQTFLGFSG